MTKVTANAWTRLLWCSGLLLALALPVYAQVHVDEIRKIDKVGVTCSNIRRSEIEGALPLQITTINLKTAKAFGIAIRRELLVCADWIVE